MKGNIKLLKALKKVVSDSKETILPLTRSNVSKVIKWTTSRYNEYRKDQVVDIAYKILVKGEGEHIFQSGTYTEKTGYATFPDYKVIGSDRSILEGLFELDRADIFHTYKFEIPTKQKKPPNVITWKSKRFRGISGKVFERHTCKWETWTLEVSTFTGDTDWRIEDIDDKTIAKGTLLPDQIEEAKKVCEAKFREIFSKSS
jgi:hypothetical protein